MFQELWQLFPGTPKDEEGDDDVYTYQPSETDPEAIANDRAGEPKPKPVE